MNSASISDCSLRPFLWGQRLALWNLTLIASIHGGMAAMIAAKYAIVCILSEVTAERENVPYISG